jgi:DNA-directed RNA polymerase subunit RPC12/RpoP
MGQSEVYLFGLRRVADLWKNQVLSGMRSKDAGGERMNSAERGVVLHCLKSMIDEEACEECPIYGMTGTDHCEKDCVRLAINALEREPCTDAISRKAVLDAISSDRYDYSALLEYVKQLSPVIPQYTDAEIQKMQELEQDEIQKAYELGKAEMQPCEDAISRQAVLEIIRKCHCEEWIKADIGAPIEALQSVTPAEKVGQWVFVKGYEGILYECTVCKDKNTHTTIRWNYCPHCGSRMMQEVKNDKRRNC